MKTTTQLALFDAHSGDRASNGSYSTIGSEPELLAAALALGARDVPGWSPQEEALTADLPLFDLVQAEELLRRIRANEDPLGEAFCTLRSTADRRVQGATYTPPGIVAAMVEAAARQGTPDRIVDPGTGSARFLNAAGRRFPRAALVGVELDPLAAILARANLAAAGLADRATVIVGDYRALSIDSTPGQTLYIGNPPYVRHHLLEPLWKQWLVREAVRRGLSASQLAGLHAYFFLATALQAHPRDFGVFITAAEWMDVNYGRLIRDLLLTELGGKRIVVIEPTALPFPDAATTAAIVTFEVGSKPRSIWLKRVNTLDELRDSRPGRCVHRERLATERRWSRLTHAAQSGPEGYVELGELCRVHRGQVTGANRVWIAGAHSEGLPSSVLFPTVTRARELFSAGSVLDDPTTLRQVIDLPTDLDQLDAADRRAVERFLERARRMGADLGYIASNRKAWWAVGLRSPAPVLATYMARRPPAFVRNRADARHINIAHGLYPREPLSETVVAGLIRYLAQATRLTDGRTYAGGLTKFEPREMERLLVPTPALLEAQAQ